MTEQRDMNFRDETRDSRFARNRTLPVRPPKRFLVQQAGNGVRVTITAFPNDSISTVGSSAIFYNVYWAESVDMTTAAGVAAGFTRATLLAPSIPAPEGRRRREATAFFSDPKFLTGYFYCCGVDALGNISAPTNPVFIGSGTGGIIPPDVEHFQCSESGEPENGSTISAVSYSFRVPVTSKSAPVDHVQFFYRNYPNLNQTSEGQSVRITAGPGGTQNGKLKLPIGRRVNTNPAIQISIAGGVNVTAPLGNGNFLTLAAAAGGDQLEVFGVRARIASVTDNNTMTLSGAWTGPAVTNAPEWQVIAAVTIYAVSESVTGARRSDVENAPSASVDLDGDLSAPNAPGLAGQSIGNGVQLLIAPVVGTAIDRYTLYRGKGSGLAFSACSPIHTWTQDQIDSVVPYLQYFDYEFIAYDKENGTVFSYYAAVMNVRGMPSAPSARVELSPRLNSSQEVDPTLTGRPGLKNLLYNAQLAGTAGNVVDTDDGGYGAATPAAGAGQNSFMFTSGANKVGRPYGGNGGQIDGTGQWPGYTLWAGTKTGGAPTQAQFQNGNEIKLPAPTVGNSVYVFQEIGSWDDARPAFMKVKKNAVLCFSIFAKYSGNQPTGKLILRIEQYNNNAATAYVPRRYRDTDNVLKLMDGSGGTTNDYPITGNQLTTSWQRFYAIFICNASLGTTKQIRFTIEHQNSVAGGDVVVTQPMINEGEELGLWCADVGDPQVGQPGTGAPPGQIGDGDGLRDGRYAQP